MTKAILFDIEGTTTPIDFVHQTLFPFARERILDYVREHFNEMQDQILQLQAEHALDEDRNLHPPPLEHITVESVTAYLLFLIDADRKSTPLKSLQGQIWKHGYESGELKGEVYDDVRPAFERLQAEGKTIAIFSSGSVLAQKLIFGHSTAGDLTSFISNYFDTNIGHKCEAESYRQIAAAMDLPADEILFISDVTEELQAAKQAGMQTFLSVRPGNFPQNNASNFHTITNFAMI
jgi:enolase-phosphatase E1